MRRYVHVVLEANIPQAKSQFFTYHTARKVKSGQEVIVPFRTRQVRGVVWKTGAVKPPFKTKEILRVVDPLPVLDPKHRTLAVWLAHYYYCSLGPAVKLFLPKRTQRQKKYALLRAKTDKRFALTKGQREVLDKIRKYKKHFFLLHGVTGSGKTEIYLRLCAEMMRRGKQVIILVPEISLTHLAIDRFGARFPGKVAVIHSRLTPSARFTAWTKIRSGKAQVIIGPRSAIFAPVHNLGLIVLDEEHDSSYKQYDQNPRYHAREVAKELARLYGAKLILGSATPSLESYFAAKKGQMVLLELPERIGLKGLPKVEVVDMRLEFRRGNRTVLSQELRDNLNKIFVQRRQAILFVNRRGAATYVFCRDCGYVLKCPNCDAPLTYHLGGGARLLCHYCNYTVPSPAFCPQCRSPYIKYFGLGTQKVEEEVKKILPRARLARFDRDSTARKGALQRIYYDFLQHKIDILIGTQMLAQGWDLPKVALIGIISAEADLNLPDFRATERTFELLTQVAGRTGRGQEVGKVILQTYTPENFAIRAATLHNYQKFYFQEIKNRQELSFPPFSTLIKLVYQHSRQSKAEQSAQKLAQKLQRLIVREKLAVRLLGPAPAFIPRIRRRYRYQIILMFTSRKQVSKETVLKLVLPDWTIDVDPESLL